jgi:hypothetical protein
MPKKPSLEDRQRAMRLRVASSKGQRKVASRTATPSLPTEPPEDSLKVEEMLSVAAKLTIPPTRQESLLKSSLGSLLDDHQYKFAIG